MVGAAVGGPEAKAGWYQRARGVLRDRAAHRDPTLPVGTLMIIIDVVWRAVIASRGYLAVDDFVLTQRAARSPLSLEFLFTPYNNHLQPGGNIVYWAVTRVAGLDYWPYLVPILLGQAVAAVIFFRLMRRIVGTGWVPVLALGVLLFSPLTLVATTWVPAAIYLVPLQLATVWALSALERYLATRGRRHLVSLGLALGFGLFFYEKSLLIAPLLVLFTACLYASGGPLRSLWQAVRGYWQAWAVLGAIAVAYLALYTSVSVSDNALRRPRTAEVAFDYLGQIVGRTLVPGLLGGPVDWYATGTGTALVDTPPVVVWVSCLVMLALVVVTIARRRSATRAWVMLAVYAPVPIAMIGATRLHVTLGHLMGLLPHYVYDIVVLAAIAIGVAIAGRWGVDEPVRPLPSWATSRPMVALAAATPAVALCAAAVSGVGYAQALAQNVSHDYVRTVRTELAQAPDGAVFVDRFVPQTVVWGIHPVEDRKLSSLLATDKLHPVFVTEGEGVLVVDDEGHVRMATVTGRSATPGPAACGWPLSDAPVAVALEGDPSAPAWAVRIAYDSTADTTATVTYGDVTRDIPVRRGTHDYLLLVDAEWGSWVRGDQVTLLVRDPAASVCASEVVVGEVVARR